MTIALRASLVIATVAYLGPHCLAVTADPAVWDLKTRGEDTIDNKIQSGRAFQSCDPALQEIIVSTARLAEEYVDATEEDLSQVNTK